MHALESIHRPIVTVRGVGLTKTFGETVALWDVHLRVTSGSALVVRGPNGSGKSTLLHIVAGLTSPTRGGLTWTTDRPGYVPRIGLLGHRTHLFDELTAIENVDLAARIGRNAKSDAPALLSSLGVEQFAGRVVRDLSTGIRRRVGLARVLATGPDVVLVDEPFAGLDAEATDRVLDALTGAKDSGRLVVIAGHENARLQVLATETLVLTGGLMHPAADLDPMRAGRAT